ncbi:hypothetical protein L1049_020015 [Liquidambar formosana]|uniref:Core Histone H2A/H2B/H3 domain-containing protein n=1 Tax=Liquidambar formosana TaxID=63359 RepID=A0AAP0X5P1_LIQFO
MARTKHNAPNPKNRRQSAARVTSPVSPGRRPAPDASAERNRKPRRNRPGTVALREIRQFQKTWKLLIPAAPFIRTVREISHIYSPQITRWTAEALIALQEAAGGFFGSFV